jgi:twitching motility protein PilT
MDFEIIPFLIWARENGASDVHLKVGSPPYLRTDGVLEPIKDFPPLSREDMEEAVKSITTERERAILRRNRGLDIAYEVEGGRYRINIFYERGHLALAARIIPTKIKRVEELNLPPVISKFAMEERGLILVTGVAGSGKSTTLAAMIEEINEKKRVRIITIEDPIEYVFRDNKSLITQREVGLDTPSFSIGLREALRQDPNVIMVGEMRDIITIETAIQAAETGHLVLSTLHTLDARETINRIISVFPSHQQNEVRVELASVLKAVISLRLVPSVEKGTRIPAVEIMVVTPRIRDLILNATRLDEIKQAIAEGFVPYGMQTFEQSLFYLWKRRLITAETALEFATEKENLALRMKGITTDQDSRYWKIFEEMALRELGEGEDKGFEDGVKDLLRKYEL